VCLTIYSSHFFFDIPKQAERAQRCTIAVMELHLAHMHRSTVIPNRTSLSFTRPLHVTCHRTIWTWLSCAPFTRYCTHATGVITVASAIILVIDPWHMEPLILCTRNVFCHGGCVRVSNAVWCQSRRERWRALRLLPVLVAAMLARSRHHRHRSCHIEFQALRDL
jgi:hypothetical protein